MRKTILGIFSSEEDAETAVEDLEMVGYEAKDISIVMKHKEKDKDLTQDTGTNVANSAVSGAVTGGVIGGIAGLLIGIGAIAVPGIGALLIGGPIAAALGITGAAAATVSGATTGVVAGGLLGALMGFGVTQEDAKVYEEKIKKGGILVAVPAQEGKEEEVIIILNDNGADQVRSVKPSTQSEAADEPIYHNPSAYQYAHAGAKGGKSKSKVLKKVPKKHTNKEEKN